jgi:hypothetical protein
MMKHFLFVIVGNIPKQQFNAFTLEKKTKIIQFLQVFKECMGTVNYLEAA